MTFDATRVAFITRSLSGGGAERVTALLANQMHRKGIAVRIVVFKTLRDEYPVDDGIECVRLDGLSGFRAVRGLRDAILAHGSNVAISLGSKYQYIAAARLFSVCPVILSERNNPALFYSVPMRLFVGYCYRRAAGVVFQTKDAASYFTTRNEAIIKNPVERDGRFWSDDDSIDRIVTSCRLEPQKNVRLLIDAFMLFHKSHPSYTLSIFGKGSLKGELEAYIDDMDASAFISLEGFAPQIKRELLHSKIFVLSSDYEGISNSLLEALSVGLPAVSTDSRGGGSREIFEHIDLGALVPCGDAGELADAITRLADSRECRRTLSMAEIAYAERLSLHTICDDWCDFIERICEDR